MQELLFARRQRTDRLLSTLQDSVILAKKVELMDKSAMFKRLNKDEWTNVLEKQNTYLKDKYGFDMLENQDIHAERCRKQATWLDLLSLHRCRKVRSLKSYRIVIIM